MTDNARHKKVEDAIFHFQVLIPTTIPDKNNSFHQTRKTL